MPAESNPSRQLARERNLAALAAMLLIVLSICAVLPAALQRRHRLFLTNLDLLSLQDQVVAVQQRTRDVQAAVVRAQSEIRRLQRQK
jgi:starvation-inducible outer membrane lipoprotein